MVLSIEQLTPGACARSLLHALNSGSRGEMQQALRRAEKVTGLPSSDPRVEEFRDLLAAVLPSVAESGPAQRAVAIRMLTHVAANC
jgi:hypothetical protein